MNKWFQEYNNNDYFYIGRTPHADTVDAVLVVAIHPKGIVINEEYRPSIDKWVLSLPGGLRDDNETYFETGNRELYEETGLELLPYNLKIFHQVFPCAGLTNEKHAVIVGDAVGKFSIKNNEDGELIRPRFYTKDELDYYTLKCANMDPYIAGIILGLSL